MNYNKTGSRALNALFGDINLSGEGPYIQGDGRVIRFYGEGGAYIVHSNSPDAESTLNLALELKVLTRGKHKQFSEALVRFRDSGKLRQFSDGLQTQTQQLELIERIIQASREIDSKAA